MWPIPDGSRQGLEDFLVEKLRLDLDFIRDELGQTLIKQYKDPRSKIKDEICVTFETKDIRDAVRAQASNLENFPQAGMRLHVPNLLQKDFKALMGLSYDLKKSTLT